MIVKCIALISKKDPLDTTGIYDIFDSHIDQNLITLYSSSKAPINHRYIRTTDNHAEIHTYWETEQAFQNWLNDDAFQSARAFYEPNTLASLRSSLNIERYTAWDDSKIDLNSKNLDEYSPSNDLIFLS